MPECMSCAVCSVSLRDFCSAPTRCKEVKVTSDPTHGMVWHACRQFCVYSTSHQWSPSLMRGRGKR
eukprot:1809996-Amphidinium_carterae.1